jgi:diketogulonate reductase-like aldo/keto reductase
MDRRDALRRIGSSVALLGTSAVLGGFRYEATRGPPASTILRRAIPSTGEMLPVVGLGTWQTFDVGGGAAERAALEAVLREFVALGGSVVDSSPMYGRAERVAGDLAAKLGIGRDLFMATKVWTRGREAGVEQMRASARALRTRAVDLMQVHNLLDVEVHLETLGRWKADGRVRYVGVSHYTAGAHADVARLIATRTLDFVQINYSAAEPEAERRLLPMAHERGVAVIANRPFASGGLLRRLAGRRLPAWAAELGCESWAQLLLKFVVAHPAVTCVIPATSKVAHLRENMRAGTGALPDERLRARIAAAVA